MRWPVVMTLLVVAGMLELTCGGTVREFPGDECEGMNVVVNCAKTSRRKRQADNDGEYEAVVSLPVQSGTVTNPDTNQATDIQKLIETILLENDELDVRSQLPNVILDPASVQLGSEYFCPDGKVVVQDQCVSCAPGTFYDRETRKCSKCSQGSFQPELGQLSCEACPNIAGKPGVTASPGSKSLDDCKERCSAGQYYSEEQDVCISCGFGKFQSEEGQFSCQSCGRGLTTRTDESIDRQECRGECGDGQQLSLDNSCQPCERGTYRSKGLQPACVACPQGTTTLGIGASAQVDCSLPVCQPGSFLNTTGGNSCSKCPLGTFQSKSHQTTCVECQPDTTTQQTGSTRADECINPCNRNSGERKCHANAFCVINTGAKPFECRCKVGFEGNGYNCSDLCTDHCDNSGACSKDATTGLPRCSCIGSFTGPRCEEKSKFAYIAGGVSGFVVIAIICVLFIWMICARANKKKKPESVQKAMTLPPDAASQVNFYYGAPTPYAESIAPSHHSNYAHYYDEEDDAWEMPNFYNDAYVKDSAAVHPGKANSLARSNVSIYGAPRQDDLYDRLRKHAYTGKKDKTDTTDDSDDQAR